MMPKGHKHTPETRAKMSAARRGRPLTAETRAKISATNISRTLSEETRAKMSAAAIRRFEKNGVGVEHRRAIGEASKKRWEDPVYRERMTRKLQENASNLRKYTPEERKKKRREYMRELRERKRAKDSAGKIRREVEGEMARNRARVAAIVAAARPIIERVERAKAMKNQPKPDAYGIIRKEPRP